MGSNGNEIPLVLIHGYPFDHTMWYSTIAALGSNARVIPPDLPGFGKTPLPANVKPSLEIYADFIAETLSRQSYAQAVIAGMSMGGYVALAFAEKYPQRTAGLGLISTQAAADSAEAKEARRESIRRLGEEGVTMIKDTILPKLFSDKAPSDLKEFATRGAQKAGADGLAWAQEAMAKRPDRTVICKEFHRPILILHGSADKIVPITKARALADECGKTIYLEVPNAGHATPLEAPDAVFTGLMRLMRVVRESQAADGLPE